MPLLNDRDKVYAGATALDAVYQGVNKIWPPAAVGPPVITGLQAWYDADDASSFTYSSGVVVSQWRDKSGANRHLAQATVSKQPTRSQTRPNGKAVVTFDGTDDYMDTAAFTVAQPLTVLFGMDTIARAQGFFSSVGGSLQIYNIQTPNRLGIFAGSAMQASIDPAGAHVWSITFNGASTKGYRDGIEIASGGAGSAGTTTGFRLAERNLVNYMQGQLFEILVYNTALSNTDRQSVEGYLRTKWGTP